MRRALMWVVLAALVGPALSAWGDSALASPFASERCPGPARGPPHGGFSDTNVFPGPYDLDGPWSRPVRAGSFRVLKPVVVVLESDHHDPLGYPWPHVEAGGPPLDVRAETARVAFPVVLFLPDLPAYCRVPVILRASPYFVASNETNLRDPPPPPDFLRTAIEQLVHNFVPHGYAVALMAMRGTANASGCIDLNGEADRADLDLALTWLGRQRWSNGNVGLIGLSNEGATTWLGAATGNSHLKTIVPLSTWADTFHNLFRNGTSGLLDPIYLAAFYGANRFPFNLSGLRDPEAEPRPDHFLCPRFVEGVQAVAWGMATGTRDPLGWMETRNLKPLVLERYRGSALLVHGLQDWHVMPEVALSWTRELEDGGIVVKQMLGQWRHEYPDTAPPAGPSRWDWAEVLLHWFEFWLRDDRSVDLGPRVQVQDGSGHWRSETAWPPRDAVHRTFFLTAAGRLAAEPDFHVARIPVGPDPGDRPYLQDVGYCPHVGDSRAPIDPVLPCVRPLNDPDAGHGPLCALCPRFVSSPLDRELRIAGPAPLPVTVVPTAPTGQLEATLFALHPGPRGLERLSFAQLDLRFADGTEEPRTVQPGEPMLARMQLEPMDALVPAGARLVLAFSQGAYGDDLPDPLNAPILLEVGGDRSRLALPVVQRGPSSFFTPPGAPPPPDAGDASEGRA